MTQSENSQQQDGVPKPWQAPTEEALRQAIATARAKRKKKITRTVVFKLHKPGRRKLQPDLGAGAGYKYGRTCSLKSCAKRRVTSAMIRRLRLFSEAYKRKPGAQKGR